MSALDDKVAIVTSATSGRGRATALTFAHEGTKVVVSGRREAEGIVRQIQSAGGEGGTATIWNAVHGIWMAASDPHASVWGQYLLGPEGIGNSST